ncbi:LysR family cyn operon transcriptional activator [Oxalobacteraceae bacterium GrIS 1.11]
MVDAMLLRHIRYLLAVAKYKNFTRAAEALHVSQPTLSQQIKQLEETLGVVLLDRSGRSVRTTDAGNAYIAYAQRALQDLEAGRRAIHDVQDLSRGLLRLAFTPTFAAYLVGPLVERFSAAHPGLTLLVSDLAQEPMEAALAEDRLDLGIAFDGARSDEIECRPLYQETLEAVVGRSHPDADAAHWSLAQLVRQPLALLTRDFATRGHIDAYFQQQGALPQIALESNSPSALAAIVGRGRLVTILPNAITRGHPALKAVALQPPLPQRTVALLSRRGAYPSAAARAFCRLAQGLSDEAWRAILLSPPP